MRDMYDHDRHDPALDNVQDSIVLDPDTPQRMRTLVTACSYLGSPSPRVAMTLRWISADPPTIVDDTIAR